MDSWSLFSYVDLIPVAVWTPLRYMVSQNHLDNWHCHLLLRFPGCLIGTVCRPAHRLPRAYGGGRWWPVDSRPINRF
jgi:hypothetical protein